MWHLLRRTGLARAEATRHSRRNSAATARNTRSMNGLNCLRFYFRTHLVPDAQGQLLAGKQRRSLGVAVAMLPSLDPALFRPEILLSLFII